MKKDERKQQILTAAVALSEEAGYANVTREAIAKEAGCATGLVNLYFGTMNQLQRAVVSEAIRVRNLNIVAQAICAKHPKVNSAPADLKRQAVDSLIGA